MLPKIARGFCNCTVTRTAKFRFRILSGKAQHHQGIFFGGVFFGEVYESLLSGERLLYAVLLRIVGSGLYPTVRGQ